MTSTIGGLELRDITPNNGESNGKKTEYEMERGKI